MSPTSNLQINGQISSCIEVVSFQKRGQPLQQDTIASPMDPLSQSSSEDQLSSGDLVLSVKKVVSSY